MENGSSRPLEKYRVAQNPTGLLDPRKHPKRGRIGNEDSVRKSVQFRHALEASGGERRHDRMIRRVEDRRDELEVLPFREGFEKGRRRERLSPGDPVLVAPAHTDLTKVELLDSCFDLADRFTLPVIPQAVTLYERRAHDRPRLDFIQPPPTGTRGQCR